MSLFNFPPFHQGDKQLCILIKRPIYLFQRHRAIFSSGRSAFLLVQLYEPTPTIISLPPTEANSASLSGVPMTYGVKRGSFRFPCIQVLLKFVGRYVSFGLEGVRGAHPSFESLDLKY